MSMNHKGSTPGFDHVETWIFDLDNTLYPASCRLFDQIDQRMGQFIAGLLGVDRTEARKVQKDYFFRYGTTLAGLMAEHGVNPDEFLTFVHDIDHSPVPRDETLIAAVDDLPGKKYICTNGTVAHASDVLSAIGFDGHFDDIFDIKAFDYEPKPARHPYQLMTERAGFEPSRAAMFEDIARNLEIPHDMGMTTVLVTGDENEDGALINHLNGDADGAHYVHHVTGDLPGFLSRLANTLKETGNE